MGSYTFRQVFEPIILPGETAQLLLPIGALNIRCVHVEALPCYTKDFGAIGAGAWLERAEVEELSLPKLFLAQIRFKVVTPGIRVYLRLPRAVERWVAKERFWIEALPVEDPLREIKLTLSEIFVWEDNIPLFDIHNPGTAVSSSIVEFFGFKFKTELIPEKGKTVIYVGG